MIFKLKDQLIYNLFLDKDKSPIFYGYALTIAANIIGTKLLTIYVPPSIMGEVSLVQSVVMILMIWPVSLQLYYLRYYSKYKTNNQTNILLSYLIYDFRRWATLVVIILGITFILVFKYSLFILYALSLISIIPQAITSILASGHNAAKRRYYFATSQILSQGFRSLLALCFAFIFLHAISILISYIFLFSVISIIVYRGLKKNEAFDFNLFNKVKIPEEIKKYRNDMLFLQIIIYLQPMIERVLLNHFSGKEIVGIFSIGNGFASQITMIIGSLVGLIFYPIVFDYVGNNSKEDEKKSVQKIKQISKYTIVVLFLLNVVVYFFKDTIVGLLFGDQYSSIGEILPFLVIGYSFFQYSNVIFLMYGQSLNKQRILIIFRWLFFCIYIFSGLLILPNFGVKGLVSVFLLSNVLLFVSYYLYTKKITKRII